MDPVSDKFYDCQFRDLAYEYTFGMVLGSWARGDLAAEAMRSVETGLRTSQCPAVYHRQQQQQHRHHQRTEVPLVVAATSAASAGAEATHEARGSSAQGRATGVAAVELFVATTGSDTAVSSPAARLGIPHALCNADACCKCA